MSRFDDAIAFASELIRIPGAPGDEAAVAERVVAELESLGFHDAWIDGAGNAIGVVRGRGSGPAVMLSSHLDVVDAGEERAWEFPPFGGVVADGFLHGRGAMDIKGPLALQTYAAATFVEAPADGDVIVAHTVQEERGGWGMMHVLEAGEVRPAAVILGEATGGDICIGHRGRAELLVEIHGAAAHASEPDRGHNTLDLLPAVLAAVGEFGRQLPAHPVLGPSTIAPTAVETLPRSRNVIPDLTRVVLDWRVLPGIGPDEALDSLEEFLEAWVPDSEDYRIEVRYATELQRTFTGLVRQHSLFTPAFLLEPDHPVAVAAADAAAGHLARRPAIRPWRFATDGGHSCGEHRIPTIGFAPGEERWAHTNRERLELDGARAIFEAYPAVIRAVQAATTGRP
jgi:succinyl-diaminopimelate desuccinylase